MKEFRCVLPVSLPPICGSYGFTSLPSTLLLSVVNCLLQFTLRQVSSAVKDTALEATAVKFYSLPVSSVGVMFWQFNTNPLLRTQVFIHVRTTLDTIFFNLLATDHYFARVEYFAVKETDYEISRECVASVKLFRKQADRGKWAQCLLW